MIRLSYRSLTAILGALALLAAAVPSLAQPAGAAASPPAAREFARRPLLTDVDISPDGQHILGLTSPDGRTTYISIWRTDAPNAKPANLGAERMQILQAMFIKNDRIAVLAQQLFTFGTLRTHLIKLYITDLEGKKWTSAIPEGSGGSEVDRFLKEVGSPEIISTLPGDPQHILAQAPTPFLDQQTNPSGSGDVYKVNVYTGATERVERGSDRYGGLEVDLRGEIRARQFIDFDNGRVYLAQQIKNPRTGAWEEHFRSYAKDRAFTEVVGFTNDPNIIYVRLNNGQDKAGLYEYDIAQRKLLAPVFQHKMFDAGVVIQSRAPGDIGRTLGFTFNAETSQVFWVDELLAATDKGLNAALGLRTTPVKWVDPGGAGEATIATVDGARAFIRAASQDRRYLIVEKSGPSQPPEYYLLAGGKLALLGRSRPTISPGSLGDSRLVQFAARDGLMIPAFLHTPPKARFGPGPFPAIVLPHGGPWARDELDWDVTGWTKYFTSHGYVVIQPQFRGSEGWGQRLWVAGDREWGQKMQDDNDDAAKYLIAQGLAAPQRIALFGYSYGGYAAFAAAIRPNGLYQCAISGAGVAELRDFQAETQEGRFIREYQRPTIEGLNVLSHAKETSIPIMVYWGDRDQIVNPNNPSRFVDALKSAGKPHRALAIKDMGHTLNTWTAEDTETQLVEVEKFLKTDCKPGGL